MKYISDLHQWEMERHNTSTEKIELRKKKQNYASPVAFLTFLVQKLWIGENSISCLEH